jgi:hypothetical protein
LIYIIHIMRSDNAGGARGAWPSRPTVSVLPPGSRRQDAGTEPSPCRSFCHSFPSTLPIPLPNRSQPRRDRSAGVTPKRFRNPVLDSGRPKPQGPPQGPPQTPPQTPPVSSWRGSTGLRPCSRVERSPSVGRITLFGLRARRLPPRLPQARRPCLHRGSHRGCHHGCHHGCLRASGLRPTAHRSSWTEFCHHRADDAHRQRAGFVRDLEHGCEST